MVQGLRIMVTCNISLGKFFSYFVLKNGDKNSGICTLYSPIKDNNGKIVIVHNEKTYRSQLLSLSD